ncbi:hypothetical protein [Rhabdaerophilum sp. SD176]|uniref:hypothetical protein n=1 Tax=Rhabdaerophilum sp. SD176 TaxID=2983548 RepID=UPI0024DFCF57|nr:hypothetical protein [Rhabdaerophilum sp. SD176]
MKSLRWVIPTGLFLALLGQNALAQTPTPRACPEKVGPGIRCFTTQDPNGAFVLIARPENGNGSLIVHTYGGPRMRKPDAAMTDQDLERFIETVREGYDWVATSRRRGGFGVTQGAEDADNARKIYIAAFGPPRYTIAHGQSWGGNIGAILIEKFNTPDASGKRPYDGAMLTSGVLAGGTRGYDMRMDVRAAFQAICNVHPAPGEAPDSLGTGLMPGSSLTRQQVATWFNHCTGANLKPEERSEAQQRALRDMAAASRIPPRALLAHIQWATFVFRDIADFITGGKSPFGNDKVRYRGTSDDEAFNRRVMRVRADPEAVRALAAESDPTGRIAIPVITMHQIHDPTVFVEQQHEYRRVIEAAGNGQRLFQTFVDDNQHSKTSPPHYPAILKALQGWIETGNRPTMPVVQANCEAAKSSYGGKCLFVPDFAPGPWATRVNPRQ